MTLNAVRSLSEALFTRLVRSIPPQRLVLDTARVDRRVYFRYFKGYRPEKITRRRILEVIRRQIVDNADKLMADALAIAWNESNWEVYEAMRQNVAKINPDVEAIERIEDDQAEDIVAELLKEFDQEDIYICTLLNEVRFSPEFKKDLNPEANAPALAEPVPDDEEEESEKAAESESDSSTEETAEPAAEADTEDSEESGEEPS